MFRRGYLRLGRWRGVPIKLHWSILLALVVFSRFRWSPGFFVAYPCLVLIHELGHALLVRRIGHRVVSVEATGLGGVCAWSGNATPFEEAAIAWGGVLAQLALLIAAELCLWVLPPTSRFGWEVMGTFTDTNLWLMAINLMPIPPLDGARAWGIIRAYGERGPANLPHGTWRDRSADAQRPWFDKLRKTRRKAAAGSEFEASPDGPLNAETQQAIDRLLKGVTGKTRDSERGDR
jgi:stage IV sporulation protein FB